MIHLLLASMLLVPGNPLPPLGRIVPNGGRGQGEEGKAPVSPRVVILSNDRSLASTLSQSLGPSYTVELFDNRRNSTFFGAKYERTTENDRQATAVFCPVLSESKLDRFAFELRTDLTSVKRYYTRTFVYLPAAKSDRDAIYLGPLVRQAAREAGVPVIESGPGSSFAEAVGDTIIDQRLEKKNWRLVHTDSQQIDEGPASMAIDGDPNTYWHTQYDPTQPRPPHEIVVDMGAAESVAGFRYVPRQDGGVNGRVKGFELYLSIDGLEWGAPALKGDLPNTTKPTRLKLDHPVTARYFRFVATSEVNNGPWTSAAEIDILRAKP